MILEESFRFFSNLLYVSYQKNRSNNITQTQPMIIRQPPTSRFEAMITRRALPSARFYTFFCHFLLPPN
jgi:hypothetical protein